MTILADNSKVNQTGRIDEHGAIRHREPELCAVGAIGFLLFGLFHILKRPVPSFAPDFSAPGYGRYGRREWYEYHLFSSPKTPTVPMTYESMSLTSDCIISTTDHLFAL